MDGTCRPRRNAQPRGWRGEHADPPARPADLWHLEREVLESQHLRLNGLDECVDGFGEADGCRSVVHRHDQIRLQQIHTVAAASPTLMVGALPTGTKSTSGRPILSACSGRSEVCPRSPRWQKRRPPNSDNITELLANVPTAASWSEPIAVTPPNGESNVPAVDSTTTGLPPALSGPL